MCATVPTIGCLGLSPTRGVGVVVLAGGGSGVCVLLGAGVAFVMCVGWWIFCFLVPPCGMAL